MENLKSFLNHYFWLIILLWLIVLGIGTFYLAGVYQEHRTDGAIRESEIKANSAISESVNAVKSADNSSIERRTEDAIRDRTIIPKLEKTRGDSINSKAELERVKQKYDDEKLHPKNLDSTDADNCRRLAVLFPNTKFADCR